MRNLPKSSRNAAMIAGSILMAAANFGVAQAATDTIYKYSTPKVGTFSFDSLAMAPLTNTIQYTNNIAGLDTDNNGCFATRVNLPHGAKITKVVVHYGSLVAPGDKTFSTALTRQQLDNGSALAIASAKLPRANTRKASVLPLDMTPPTNLIINNNQYAYSFGVCLGPADLFFAGRITYTYDNAGD